jgi:hypothetical protein
MRFRLRVIGFVAGAFLEYGSGGVGLCFGR